MNESKKYYFYNPETGVGWEEEMTESKKERFLENRPWIEERIILQEKIDAD